MRINSFGKVCHLELPQQGILYLEENYQSYNPTSHTLTLVLISNAFKSNFCLARRSAILFLAPKSQADIK
ncbi:hypothetical protein WH95_06785 [Kiloniella litopenaei]|uniref:Uncharacterized protein n=1 Tax=Kiloniella litopenaei TaxID=1549748 RepID=A0A0M2RAG5_9PROT|nr:hypothetical protein WH95_06785 [Kiloniella litopenaei]